MNEIILLVGYLAYQLGMLGYSFGRSRGTEDHHEKIGTRK